MTPSYEIGRIFTRFHSALGVTPTSPLQSLVTRRHLPTGLMKPKIKIFQMFFFSGASIAQLGTPGNTRAQANFSDAFCLFEDHERLFPGTVPSNIHFPPCVSK
jgi:hypothetical protein